jgi:hypothetical protein
MERERERREEQGKKLRKLRMRERKKGGERMNGGNKTSIFGEIKLT